ncbi:hypothetical protein ABDK56_05445 [Sphingomonas sp. ASV193]|uniref:hypothetical protein n=1 Tax=Sphingomonas sp. ASV193 TaxID=3144405 RepID=UPI0032E85D65
MAGEPDDEPQQRVRIGLTGLAFVFLLVLLGTMIIRSSESSAPSPPVTANNAVADEPNEPLAEIGAAPGQAASDNAATPAKKHK